MVAEIGLAYGSRLTLGKKWKEVTRVMKLTEKEHIEVDIIGDYIGDMGSEQRQHQRVL